MIRIAICDDLPADIEKMKTHIIHYSKENSLQISVMAYSTQNDILKALKKADTYDIIFLDIYMETLNGIDLARHIRKQGVKSRIIFFSTSEDHALAAFGVNAIQYLVKPVEYEVFANAMKLALIDKAHREEALSIEFDYEIIKVPFESIVYVESQRNYQYLFVTNGEPRKTRMTCSELFDYMRNRPEFVRVGASYIINMEYVIKISSRDIELTDNKKIPMPRGSYATLKEKYINYFDMGGNTDAGHN